MPKQLGIIIGVLAVVAIGGVVVYTQLKKSPQTQPETPAAQQKVQQPSMIKGSIKSLLTAGKNVTCKISYPDNKTVTGGTVYISGKKMAGEFTAKGADGKESQSRMIQDGDYAYIWSSANSQGTKMKITEQMKAQGQQAAQQNVDLEKEVNLDCSNWSPDNSKFTPPANVQFTDISEMMMQKQSPATTPASGKSPCEAITDPTAKAACMKSSGY